MALSVWRALNKLTARKLIPGISACQLQKGPERSPKKYFCISPEEARLAAALKHGFKSSHRNSSCSGTQIISNNDSLDISGLFASLSITSNPTGGENAIRLPSLEGRLPISAPTTTPIIVPHSLPQHQSTVSLDMVEPWLGKLPMILPQPTSQRGDVRYCHYMIRLRHKKLKRMQRKKRHRKNRVKHEHRVLLNVIRKEKAFQAEQVALLREAEAFDAEKHVKDILARVNNRPIPKFFCGKRLPAYAVVEKMVKMSKDKNNRMYNVDYYVQLLKEGKTGRVVDNVYDDIDLFAKYAKKE